MDDFRHRLRLKKNLAVVYIPSLWCEMISPAFENEEKTIYRYNYLVKHFQMISRHCGQESEQQTSKSH
jgi:hypothetical protein